jgi:hypothetical protein
MDFPEMSVSSSVTSISSRLLLAKANPVRRDPSFSHAASVCQDKPGSSRKLKGAYP